MKLREKAKKIVLSKAFSTFILVVVLINSIVLGLQTSPAINEATGNLFIVVDKICLYIFILEAIFKIAVLRRKYFLRGWNWFDFIIVLGSVLADFVYLSSFRVLRVIRVFRALKFISGIKHLQIIVTAIGHSLPSIMWTTFLMSLIYYIFSVMGTMLFAEHFPDWFGSIPKTMYTLFQVMTLDGWSMEIVRPVMEEYPYAWLYFIPFVIISAFIILNIVVGIVVNSISKVTVKLDSSKKKNETDEQKIYNQIKNMRKLLDNLELELSKMKHE